MPFEEFPLCIPTKISFETLQSELSGDGSWHILWLKS